MRNKRSVLGLSMLLPLSMLLFLVGCAKKEDKVVTINVSYGSYTDAALIIAEKKGFFEKNLPGYTIEYTHVASSPDIRDGVVSEQIDVASMSIFSYISAFESGVPLTLISFNCGTPVYAYSSTDRIQSVADIQHGDRIAINNKVTVIHFAFLAYCKEMFGEAMRYDNQISTISAADTIASLQTSADYEVALFNFPTCVKAEQIEGVTRIADFTEYVNEYNIGACEFTRDEYYDEYPEVIAGVRQAQLDGIAFMKSNSEEAAQILADVYGIEAEDVLEVFEIMLPSVEITGYDKIASLMYEIGVLEKEPVKFRELRNYEDIPK